MPCSLNINNIGDDGAAHIGAALKDNTALQKLLYVAPWPPRATAASSAGWGAEKAGSILTPRLAMLAVSGPTESATKALSTLQTVC